MGIKRFYGGFLRSPKFKRVRTNRIPKNIDGVSLDMNGGIHKVAQKTYAYGEKATKEEKDEVRKLLKNNPEELENNFFSDLTEYLADVLLTLSPQKYFIICVDGVALLAKVTQQRSRRYKSAKDNEGKEVLFDSSSITPGTDFMLKVDLFFQNWIKDKRDILPEIVIYSSHMEKGEGEHKIFDILRDNIIEEGTGYHAIIGMDADLTILSSLSHIENIILVREDWNDVLNISFFRDELIAMMSSTSSSVISHEEKRLFLQDFALITFLIGNDFIPHNMSLDDVGESIFFMLSIYSSLGYRMTGEDGSINWLAFYNFLSALSHEEPLMIKNKAEKEMKYPSTILESVYGDRKKEKEEQRYLTFRQKWYEHALMPRRNYFTEIEFVNDENIDDMCESYIFGLQWNLKYYLDHSVTNTYVYKYLYAPLITDVKNYIFYLIENDRNKLVNVENVDKSDKDISNYGPIHQLVSVISPLSADIIPKKYRSLILPGGDLSHLCPLNFELELEGVNKEFEALAILPPLDVPLIVDSVNRIMGDRIPSQYKEVKRWVSILQNNKQREGGGRGGRGYVPQQRIPYERREGGRGYERTENAGRGGRGYERTENAGRGGRGYERTENAGRGGRGYVPQQRVPYERREGGRGYVPQQRVPYERREGGRDYVPQQRVPYERREGGRGYERTENAGRGGRGYVPQQRIPYESKEEGKISNKPAPTGLSIYSTLAGATEFIPTKQREYRKVGGVNVLEF
jgi:5'-3' exonuclease